MRTLCKIGGHDRTQLDLVLAVSRGRTRQSFAWTRFLGVASASQFTTITGEN